MTEKALVEFMKEEAARNPFATVFDIIAKAIVADREDTERERENREWERKMGDDL